LPPTIQRIAGSWRSRSASFTSAADVLALLRACGERPRGRRTAEQRDELSAIARQILPAAAFPRFPTRKLFVDMPRRLDVPLQWFVGHFPVRNVQWRRFLGFATAGLAHLRTPTRYKSSQP
jgi:hypothetical protein